MKPISKNRPDGSPKPEGLYEWQAAHGVMDDDPLLAVVGRTFELQSRFGQIVGEEAEKLIIQIRKERQFFESAEKGAEKALLAMAEEGKQRQAERLDTLAQTEAKIEAWRKEMAIAAGGLAQQARAVENQQAYLLSLDSHLAVSLGPKLAAALAARVDEIAERVDIKKLEASLDYLEEATRWLEEFRPQTERELKAAAAAVNEQLPRLAQLAKLIQTMQEETHTKSVVIALLLGGLAGAAITWFLMR